MHVIEVRALDQIAILMYSPSDSYKKSTPPLSLNDGYDVQNLTANLLSNTYCSFQVVPMGNPFLASDC